MNTAHRDHLDTFGFVVLRGFVEPRALSAEFDASMRAAFADPGHLKAGAAGNEFRYVPTMCERTPVSLSLLRRLAPVASELLGAPVLPSRAKATTYRGSTGWHRDTALPVRSVGFALYLEPLGAADGALRVLPGSHRAEYGATVAAYAAQAADMPSVAVPTVPGDVIAFDEHLYHASSGGDLRRQWRVDFVADVPGGEDALRAYFAGQYSSAWDGGYDVVRFPSYGDHWRTIDPRWNERLGELGAYGAAAAEEAAVRARRR
jgi:hypothetical protein